MGNCAARHNRTNPAHNRDFHPTTLRIRTIHHRRTDHRPPRSFRGRRLWWCKRWLWLEHIRLDPLVGRSTGKLRAQNEYNVQRSRRRKGARENRTAGISVLLRGGWRRSVVRRRKNPHVRFRLAPRRHVHLDKSQPTVSPSLEKMPCGQTRPRAVGILHREATLVTRRARGHVQPDRGDSGEGRVGVFQIVFCSCGRGGSGRDGEEVRYCDASFLAEEISRRHRDDIGSRWGFAVCGYHARWVLLDDEATNDARCSGDDFGFIMC